MTLTPLTESDLRNLTRLCNPAESLQPGDLRNIDIDRPASGESPRGDGWASRLKKRLTRASDEMDSDALGLFSGLPGSGKTTELRRLRRSLRNVGWLPVLVDAEAFVDLNLPIDLPDVLLPILYETERAVVEAEGGNPDAVEDPSWLVRFADWFRSVGVELKGIDLAGELPVGLPSGAPAKLSAKAAVSFSSRPVLRRVVRDAVSQRPAKFHEEVAAALVALQARARAVTDHPNGLVLIVDSLEKLHGGPSNWQEVLQSAEELFVRSAQWLKLPVPVLYTVPPELVLYTNLLVDFMPMVKLHAPQKPGVRHDPGYDALRRLIDRRIPLDEFQRLLGLESGDAARAHIDQLIALSGGYPRILIRLLRELLLEADPVVTARGFVKVLRRERDSYAAAVRFQGESIPWLASVAWSHKLEASSAAERAIAVRMVSTNLVLKYLNDREWWDVHPAVREMPEIASALSALGPPPPFVP